ncbi:3D-(3,5/4)-trihydroxycyclohexane-1,2-dione acylhydrolase (decyclizing) [Leucobacter tenebrionis]|uniref:3D-(3,5/4)-trihydroxycyclohexane-1,2-dione acylhydrolase (decyclizing) n=1 Tax=Leucobacter tenebrionis TaxID=2873270 RepID=UPI001CA6F71C|nr:3D-(3,5/4)-trihydroxycyclohexane-1,2-dione acylhydrolase (decyclizing) [Leucobacter tenebrionis]QZY50777.1 3D-(3,5/4)-trihydroxycyclohexane-1,2-dione acylhydrolase (decyclizing) [Leucobacter tenebrionis]
MVQGTSGQTVRLTVAQAIVRYVAAQYSVADGERRRFVPAALGIFGHGNVAGLGQALAEHADRLPFVQGRNEQALGHMATGFAKATKRRQTLAVTASIGPGATNLVTAAALATVNRIPLLLFPGDTYATRRQGPVLQQLDLPGSGDVTANDTFRPVSRFFDRINRPEQLLTALPQAFRVLANAEETGAVVVALPQDVQSHAFDFPVEFFEERDWPIRRRAVDTEEVKHVAELIKRAERPLVIAGGGIHYSDAQAELTALGKQTLLPVSETFAGKGAITEDGPWSVFGIGLEGSPNTNRLAERADLVVHIGTRLTDFATASQSLFANPDVRFASINVVEHDAVKQGATAIVADAKLALTALAAELDGYCVPAAWADEVEAARAAWVPVRDAALDPDTRFPKEEHPELPETDAVLTQGQLIGLMQEHARSGDTIVAAAGGPPGDLQKVWDATGGRHAHLEFGFSCMGYELPAAMGVRVADPDPAHRITAFIGDGTFIMMPTEIVTAAQEGIPFTVVISENHGYQVIRRLQMWRTGEHFGNEFRYREGEGALVGAVERAEAAAARADRLEGDYLKIDLAQIAAGLGAEVRRPTTAAEVRTALDETRGARGPVVLVVPTIPHADLPGAEAWWDVSPAEVWEHVDTSEKLAEYGEGLAMQRWHG